MIAMTEYEYIYELIENHKQIHNIHNKICERKKHNKRLSQNIQIKEKTHFSVIQENKLTDMSKIYWTETET